MILVFGKTGQVARIAPGAIFLGRDLADLSNPAACIDTIQRHSPTAVINAAAYTAVDRAEEEEALALRINAAAPGAMAKACTALQIPLVHISTDYVFDGTGNTPFTPDHPPAPLSAYGRTKLAGEEAVRAAGGAHVILRTSWVFSAYGSNFLRTMLRLGAERDSLRVVADQIGGPTPAVAIASACLNIAQKMQADPNKGGILHFSGAPDVSWAGFAREIMHRAELTCQIEDIPTTDYPTPARRPLNSRLECTGLARFGLVRPDWRICLADTIAELREEI